MSSESIKEAIMLSAQKAQTPQPIPLPKRFYKEASHDNGILMLDGRKAKTPAKNFLQAPLHCADQLVKEWQDQVAVINPKTMPLTRLLNSLIDGVTEKQDEVKADILKYAGSDLICYREDTQPDLIARQAELWQPVLDYFRDKHNAPFITVSGIRYTAQPDRSIEALAKILPQEPLTLGSIQSIMTLTGSALMAIALYEKALTPANAWKAAHIDEDFQIELWGDDDEAIARRAFRFEEYMAALKVLSLA